MENSTEFRQVEEDASDEDLEAYLPVAQALAIEQLKGYDKAAAHSDLFSFQGPVAEDQHDCGDPGGGNDSSSSTFSLQESQDSTKHENLCEDTAASPLAVVAIAPAGDRTLVGLKRKLSVRDQASKVRVESRQLAISTSENTGSSIAEKAVTEEHVHDGQLLLALPSSVIDKPLADADQDADGKNKDVVGFPAVEYETLEFCNFKVDIMEEGHVYGGTEDVSGTTDGDEAVKPAIVSSKSTPLSDFPGNLDLAARLALLEEQLTERQKFEEHLQKKILELETKMMLMGGTLHRVMRVQDPLEKSLIFVIPTLGKVHDTLLDRLETMLLWLESTWPLCWLVPVIETMFRCVGILQ